MSFMYMNQKSELLEPLTLLTEYCTALYINSYTAAIRRQLAVMRQSLQIKQFTCKVLVKRDKLGYNESLVQKAELAARSNDPKTTYAIVRQLGEFEPSPLKSVLLKSGSPAQTDRQADERWQEHF